MFTSKKLSIVSTFALLVSSLSIAGFGASAANADVPSSYTSIKINDVDVDIIGNAATVNFPSGTTSASLAVVSADVQYLTGTLDSVALTTTASDSGFRRFAISQDISLHPGDQTLVLRTFDDNNHATNTNVTTITLTVAPHFSALTLDGNAVTSGSTTNLANGTTSAVVALTLTDPLATVTFGSSPTATKAADSDSWTISDLVTGNNLVTFTITDSAVGSLTGSYSLNLRVLSNDASLSTFTVNGLAVLDGSTVILDAYTTSVSVVATATDSNATVVLAGNTNLSTGDNTLTATVTAENGVVVVNTVTLSVSLSNDTSLSTFTVNDEAVLDGSTVVLNPYTTSVDVVATASDSNSTVIIAGNDNLAPGDNTMTVTVTAPNGDVVINSVTLSVSLSTDTVAAVTINGEVRAEGEDIYVVYGTSSVLVSVATNDANATYFIDGDLALETGDNEVLVTVIAADGTTTQDYIFNVIVQLNTDTSVNSITVNGESVIDGSALTLDPLTVEVDVQVDTTDIEATYTVEGATDLVTGDNQLMITVIAADGETEQQYFVLLTVLPNTDATVSSVTVNGSVVEENDYFHVDPLTTEVEIEVVTTDSNATYEVEGGTDLVAGENDLSITITAEDGVSTYTFFATIVVDPNTDTSVESITVNGEATEDGGTVYLDPFTEDVDVAVTTADPDATYVIDGDVGLSVGDNTLTIFVTAADGLTTTDYVVTLVVALSNDASISEISITYMTPDGAQTVSAGDGDEIDLPSNTLSVDVEVVTGDTEATYEVSGNTDLVVGENTITITVTAPDGEATEDAYITLNVAVGDVTTSSFTVNGNEVSDGDIVDLEPGTESVDVAVVTTDDLATYEITGGYELVLGANTLTVAVTSVDETLTVTYTVTLNVLPYDDATISSIEINSVVWEDGVVLVTDAGDLDVTVNLNNEFATYVVIGDTTDISGIVTLTVTVTAQDGETTEEAQIVVLAESDLVIAPAIADAELRVGTYALIPRTQFPKTATVAMHAWFIDNDITTAVSGAKHLLTADDFGHSLRAGVVVTLKGGTPVTYISRAIEVLPGIMKKGPTPSIKGKAAVGNTLTASTKAWPDGVETSLQWYRDGVAIDGATSDTYDLVADDLGGLITVGITGTMDGYEPLEKISKGLTIIPGTLRYSSKPGISGDFVTGGTIVVDPGTWTDGAEVSLVWMRDGEEIATTSADENSYVLTADDYKHRISVDVVVTLAGYNNLTFKIKAKSVKIGTFTEAMTPEISGNAMVGESLDVNVGDYPDGATFKFVWKRNGRVIQGASQSSYELTARDVNTTITVKVIATIPGYKTVRIDSDGVDVTPAQ